MNNINVARLAAGLALAASWLSVGQAHAHISMIGDIKSRDGDQKHFPCDGARGAGPVYTYEPGTTITLKVAEGLGHPGYFRVAFDNDGEDAFLEPKSIKPVNPARKCPSDNFDKCGESDFCNVVSADGGPTVLWDNIQPHISSLAMTANYSWNIKLPDVECENCVLQVIQVMEDDDLHGAYCPTGNCDQPTPPYVEDIYHRCIDITLKKGATNGPGVTTDPENVMGMQCSTGSAPTDPPPSTAGTGGGASTAGSAAAAGSTGATAGSSSTGSAGTASATAGTTALPAAGSGSTVVTPTPGAAGTGVVTSPATAAGTGAAPVAAAGTYAAPVTPVTGPTNTTNDGGCSVTSNSTASANNAAWLLLTAGMMFVRRRRSARRNAC